MNRSQPTVSGSPGSGSAIAVAMSGGVDSSVAAALLKADGLEVLGVTAVMTSEYSRCCSDEDVRTAQQVARDIGIPHHVVDVREVFQSQVMDTFTREYLAGRTPSPCVVCNRAVKFGALLDHARRLGADRIATGHYARATRGPAGAAALLRGVDAGKDQSYFLARLTQEQLAASAFPLGEMQKRQVSALAARFELACRRSKESQELCFIAEGTHGDWIDVRSFDTSGRGDIVDTTGKKLGEHLGIHHYTVGQRKGLGVATGERVYVTRIDAGTNTVILGAREDAMRSEMSVTEVSWIGGQAPASPFRALTQIRYNHRAAPSAVQITDEGGVEVSFDEPQFAVTPGQLAAFYDGDRVLGGGWIA